MLRGEFGIKIKSIDILKYDNNYDIKINDNGGGFIYIVGDNDVPTLFQNALKTIIFDSQELYIIRALLSERIYELENDKKETRCEKKYEQLIVMYNRINKFLQKEYKS